MERLLLDPDGKKYLPIIGPLSQSSLKNSGVVYICLLFWSFCAIPTRKFKALALMFPLFIEQQIVLNLAVSNLDKISLESFNFLFCFLSSDF